MDPFDDVIQTPCARIDVHRVPGERLDVRLRERDVLGRGDLPGGGVQLLLGVRGAGRRGIEVRVLAAGFEHRVVAAGVTADPISSPAKSHSMFQSDAAATTLR